MRRTREGIPSCEAAMAKARRRRGDRSACALAIWRTLPRARIAPSHVAALSRILAATSVLHDLRWRVATAGDPAMSAAIAIDHLRRRSVGSRLGDLAMSNLVVRAMEGDRTAPVILRNALTAIARLDPSDRRPVRLAAGWLDPGPARSASVRRRGGTHARRMASVARDINTESPEVPNGCDER